MDNTRKRRLLAALASVAVASAGATAAHAAGAPIDPLSVLASSTTVTSCHTVGVAVDYEVAYVADLGGYAVTAAHLDGIDPSCAGSHVAVVLAGEAGPLAELDATLTGGGRTTLPVPVPVPASDLTGVSVVLTS